MNLHLWVIFATAYLATTISPGPNVLLVIRNSLKYGAQASLPTIFGNLSSQLLIIVLVGSGVGAVIATFPPFFTVMKLIGAAYLGYLGIKQLLSDRSSAMAIESALGAVQQRSRKSIFVEAFLVSSGNPKTLIFLSAFLPQFIDHEHALGLQFSTMYLTIACIVLTVHCIYAQSSTRLKDRVAGGRFVSFIKRSSGALFIALGLKLALSERP